MISFENSADEGLAYSLGELFYLKPELIVRALKKFNGSQKKYLHNKLTYGLANFTHDMNDKNEILLERLTLLEKLKKSLDY